MQGKDSILVTANGVCVGVIALSDVIRPAAEEMIHKLTAMLFLELYFNHTRISLEEMYEEAMFRSRGRESSA